MVSQHRGFAISETYADTTQPSSCSGREQHADVAYPLFRKDSIALFSKFPDGSTVYVFDNLGILSIRQTSGPSAFVHFAQCSHKATPCRGDFVNPGGDRGADGGYESGLNAALRASNLS